MSNGQGWRKPETIIHGAITYTLKWDGENRELYGTTDHIRQTVTLNSELTNQRMRQTLLHEILHIVAVERGLTGDDQPLSDEAVHEHVIEVLSGGLLDMLVDNAHLTALITADANEDGT